MCNMKEVLPTSEQILESLYNDVKNSSQPIDLTELITVEKNEKTKSEKIKKDDYVGDSRITNGSKKKKSSKKKKKKSKTKKKDSSTNGNQSDNDSSKRKSKKQKSRTKSHSKSRKKTRSPSRRSRKRSRSDSSNSYLKRPRRSSSRSDSDDTYADFDRRRSNKHHSRSRSRSRSRSSSSGHFRSSPSRFHSSSVRYKRSGYYRRTSPGRYSRFPRFRRMFKQRFNECDYVDEHGKIDKGKLLEIATKNAAKLAMEGKLPKGVEFLDSMKNKSINELVTICQQLHEEEKLMEKVSSDEDERYDRRHEKLEKLRAEPREDDDFVPKPVRLASEIKINIANANSLPIKTPQQRMADEGTLRMAFPVSSGVQHREKSDDWSLVIKSVDEGDVSLTATLSQMKTNIPIAYKQPENDEGSILSVRNANSSLMPPPPEPPMVEVLPNELVTSTSSSTLPPPPPPPVFGSFDSPSPASAAALVEAVKKRAASVNVKTIALNVPIILPPPPLPPSSNMMWDPYQPLIHSDVVSSFSNNTLYSEQSVLSTCDNGVFPVPSTAPPRRSVQELIAERLEYSNRLKEDPNDFFARKCIADIDEEVY